MDRHFEMRGWLHKEKSKATAFGGDTNRRWFAIEQIEGVGPLSDGASRSDEQAGIASDADSPVPDLTLALCYYKSKAASPTEKCGWFFLADVETVEQDAVGKWITIRHPSRTYRLMAPNHSEHNSWFEALTTLCCGGKSSCSGGDGDDDEISPGTKTVKEMSCDDTESSSEKDDETEGKDEGGEEEEEEESKAVTEMNFLRQLTGRSPLEKPAERPMQEMQDSPSPDVSRGEHTTPHPTVENTVEHNVHCDVAPYNQAETESEQVETLPNFISRWEHEERVPCEEPDAIVSCDDDDDDDGMFSLRSKSPAKVRTSDRTYDHRLSSRPFDVDIVSNDSLNKRLGRAIEDNPVPLDPSDQGTRLAHVTMVEDIGLLEENSSSSSDDDTVDLSLEKHVRSHFANKTPSRPPVSLSIKDRESEEEQASSPIDATMNRAESATKEHTKAFIPPGLTPDKNFATEDWDDPSPEQRNRRGEVSPAKSKAPRRNQHYCSIQPDVDFVDANWDDE